MLDFQQFHDLSHVDNSQTLAYLFGLGSPIGVRFLSGLGTVLRMRI